MSRLARALASLLSLLVLCGLARAAACPSGAPLVDFYLMVEPGGGAMGRSIRAVNRIVPGQKLIYTPANRLPEALKKAQVALVVAPSGAGGSLAVLQPQSARALAEWKAPFRASVVALVFGPQGLDAKKVSTLFQRDRRLVEQLADYAQQTSSTETLLSALASWDRTPTATENLNAALAGFSAAFGRPLPSLDRNAPADQQVATLLRALNPALAAYDPLAPEPQQRLQQSALLAATVGGLFFGSPVGLAAGGASLFMNLSSMMFPDTDFRSAFAQPGLEQSLVLCAKPERTRSRARQAYLWAVRIPDADPPSLALASPARVLAGAKALLPVRAGEAGVWKNLARAREWRLKAAGSGAETPVAVKAVPEKEALEIDFTGVAAGVYSLAGAWDWETFTVDGDIRVHQLSPDPPRLARGAGDRLVRGSGAVPVEIEGCDLEFLESLEIRKPGGEAERLEFARTEAGLTARLDTNALEAGRYALLLYFPDGTVRETPLRILPPHPRLEGLPLRVNLGEATQRIRLRGSDLERIERIASPLAEFELLGEAQGNGREAVVRLTPNAREGDRSDLAVFVEGVEQPLPAPGALQVIGPRPRIDSAQASLPEGIGVELAQGELPAGSFAGFSLRVGPLESPPTARVECVEGHLTIRAETARLDEPGSAIRLRQTGAGTLYLTLDPGGVGQAGCTLTVTVATEAQGSSDPFVLGKVVRLPRIDKFEVSDRKAGEFGYAATLTGEELERIERVGWSADFGLPVTELPVPLASGEKQALEVTVPWPPPAPRAPLYVWLRGESRGRKTKARY